jgi:HEAT repeat protein
MLSLCLISDFIVVLEKPEIVPNKVWERVQKLRNSDSEDEKIGAARALGKIDDERIIPYVIPDLVKFLHERDYGVKSAVAEALGNIGGKEVIPHLIRAHKELGGQVSKEYKDIFVDAIKKINERTQKTI